MKIEKNNHYFTIALYTIVTSLLIVIGTLMILNFKTVWQDVCEIVVVIYGLLKPLFLGVLIAYLLDPLVEFYEKRCQKMNWHTIKPNGKKPYVKKELQQERRWHMRTVPTLFAFITVILIFGLFILVIIVNVQEIAGSFSILSVKESINGYFSYFEQMLKDVTLFIEELGFFEGRMGLVQKLNAYLNTYVSRLSAGFMNSLTAVGINTMNGLLAFVIAFYLLQDKQRCLALVNKICRTMMNARIHKHFMTLAHDIDYVFSGYIRGQMIDSFIIAVLTSLLLTFIQLDFAIIIGIVAGIFNLIPYFGPIVGFVLAVIIGILDPNPMKAVYGAGAIFVLQQIDGWIIVPKVVGESVKLHPVLVLLAILIGGNLFGLVGMLLGVPVAAFIRLVLLRYMTEIFPDGEEVLKEEIASQDKAMANQSEEGKQKSDVK